MKIELDHFDIKQTADSGQCFRWKEEEDGKFSVVSFDRKLCVKRDGASYDFDCDTDEWDKIWARYFDTRTDYFKIEELVRTSGDKHLLEAYEKGAGIRILRQDLWEMIISFLISQNNNIPRIKGSIEAICKKAGFKAENSDTDYRFPKPYEIDREFFDDRSLGLGYRVPYLQEMFEFAKNDPDWITSLYKPDYEGARKMLLSHLGIGPKVADCICLFGLHHIEAFPIDTHVKQLLAKYYPGGFDHEFFKGYAGVIQQYLFYYEIK